LYLVDNLARTSSRAACFETFSTDEGKTSAGVENDFRARRFACCAGAVAAQPRISGPFAGRR
jgi:hypothetical protein